MKRIYLTMMLLGLFAIAAQAQTPTPTPASSPSPVYRVTYYDLKPGKGADYMKFRRETSKPIADEAKKQGVILDYMWLTNPTGDGPNNWDVALVLVYKTTRMLSKTRNSQKNGTQFFSSITARKKPETRQTHISLNCAMLFPAI